MSRLYEASWWMIIGMLTGMVRGFTVTNPQKMLQNWDLTNKGGGIKWRNMGISWDLMLLPHSCWLHRNEPRAFYHGFYTHDYRRFMEILEFQLPIIQVWSFAKFVQADIHWYTSWFMLDISISIKSNGWKKTKHI